MPYFFLALSLAITTISTTFAQLCQSTIKRGAIKTLNFDDEGMLQAFGNISLGMITRPFSLELNGATGEIAASDHYPLAINARGIPQFYAQTKVATVNADYLFGSVENEDLLAMLKVDKKGNELLFKTIQFKSEELPHLKKVIHLPQMNRLVWLVSTKLAGQRIPQLIATDYQGKIIWKKKLIKTVNNTYAYDISTHGQKIFVSLLIEQVPIFTGWSGVVAVDLNGENIEEIYHDKNRQIVRKITFDHLGRLNLTTSNAKTSGLIQIDNNGEVANEITFSDAFISAIKATSQGTFLVGAHRSLPKTFVIFHIGLDGKIAKRREVSMPYRGHAYTLAIHNATLFIAGSLRTNIGDESITYPFVASFDAKINEKWPKIYNQNFLSKRAALAQNWHIPTPGDGVYGDFKFESSCGKSPNQQMQLNFENARRPELKELHGFFTGRCLYSDNSPLWDQTMGSLFIGKKSGEKLKAFSALSAKSTTYDEMKNLSDQAKSSARKKYLDYLKRVHKAQVREKEIVFTEKETDNIFYIRVDQNDNILAKRKTKEEKISYCYFYKSAGL